MRLLNIHTFEIEEFYDPPKYAILSHTWDREMTLQQWRLSSKRRRRKYKKVACAAKQATLDGLGYVWIDTICIDKTSSAELSEAINLMFSWYEAAEICYAHLSDVVFDGSGQAEQSLLRESRWFTRGWTLQELIAPSEIIFYSSEWRRIGTRDELGDLISRITKIEAQYLTRERSSQPKDGNTTKTTYSSARTPFHHATIAERLSWVSNRVTTRPEDIAYCLLGLFRINMPLLYGERTNAWIRLQKELIAVSDDESIFAWVWVPRLEMLMNDDLDESSLAGGPTTRLDHLVRTKWKYLGGSTMFAPDPVNFHGCEDQYSFLSRRKLPYSMTNAGLFMKLPLIRVGFDNFLPVYLAVLRCRPAINGWSEATFDAVVLKRCDGIMQDAYQRDKCRFLCSRIQVDAVHVDFNSVTEVYIEDTSSREDLSHNLAFEPNEAFTGFWIAFPRGLHSYKVVSHQWGQKTGGKYARSYPHMGIIGFNIDPSRKDYLGTLMFYKGDIQTHSLNLGIILDSDGAVSWTYNVIVCKTDNPAHESKGLSTDLTVEQQNDGNTGQMNVSFGILNSSWSNNCQVRMTYITFDDNDDKIVRTRRYRSQGAMGPVPSRFSLA